MLPEACGWWAYRSQKMVGFTSSVRLAVRLNATR